MSIEKIFLGSKIYKYSMLMKNISCDDFHLQIVSCNQKFKTIESFLAQVHNLRSLYFKQEKVSRDSFFAKKKLRLAKSLNQSSRLRARPKGESWGLSGSTGCSREARLMGESRKAHPLCGFFVDKDRR